MRPRFFILTFLLGFAVLAAVFFGSRLLSRSSLFRALAGSYEEAADVKALRAELKAYTAQASKLSAEEAAGQWLVLFDAWTQVYQDIEFEKLVEVLPPVQTWDALAEAIEKRPQNMEPLQRQCLILMSAVLRDDSQGRQQAMAGLRDLITKYPKIAKHGVSYFQESVDRIGRTLDTLAGSPQEQVAALAATLDAYEKDESMVEEILIPDLLQEADEATVAPLIARALRLKAGISVSGKQTRRLTSKLALENLPDLKRPVWEFVETEADLPLYEGLVKKFPDDDSSHRSDAERLYLLHLIAAGRTEEAMAFTLNRIGNESGVQLTLHAADIDAMQKQGFGRQMLDFLRTMLSQQPALPLWQVFIELSAHEGQSREALQLLREAVAKPALAGRARSEVEGCLYRALLAADEVDEGVKILREMVKRGPAKTTASPASISLDKLPEEVKSKLSPEAQRNLQFIANHRQDTPEREQIDLAEVLLSLGLLLNMPELVDEAVAGALAAYAQIPEEGTGSVSEMWTVTDMLVKAGRSSTAETFLKDRLVRASNSGSQRRFLHRTQDILVTLMGVYDKAGQYGEIVQLLDTSPGWRAKDLADLAQTSFRDSVLVMVAKALAETGKTDVARRIAQRAVQQRPDKDSAYALLLSLGGDDLESRLDALQAAHRFQERPLIWKAQLQLNQGRLEEAEKSVRAAIAIDPSDGEQGKGDRMRAYAVLADILEKKGDAEQAATMRGAVKAIRISENADDWWNAGLLSRAVARYEEALTHFADAYCIQSRLALRYSELGDFAKAEMHYRRAFELMPDSFGRVESHCFGCEGAFKGKRAQNIADQVFTRLALKMPDKPQISYLLGYLRDQQGNHTEAVSHYRRAVTLDPDYLNAWKKLLATTDHVPMPRAEREQATLALFRLDPATQNKGLESMASLPLLWEAILAAEAAQLRPETGPLYPLTAAAEFAAKNRDLRRELEYKERREAEDNGYRKHLGQNRLMQTVGQMFDQVNQGRF
ncbi:tetratricopeptide repeat protein [Prosthecobacter fusiformis]|uniref:Tetratricopeptide repeat protein n=1 Tax=Prosthecobacter fusiformis TaxID=48464 RepID=A0A4R7RP85_9BACT|nr:tetratricopeptide repeat protein [Prosthecobacter fusiformis]TDU66047.1 tetratricopeptide repeat protein [Prosthecobacter fusiformis]